MPAVVDLLAIAARYEVFSGPLGEQMEFKEYSEMYDEFVDRDLPRLLEYARALEAENAALKEEARSGRD